MSDDEGELQLLRMAALQTLRQRAEKPAAHACKQTLQSSGPSFNTYNQYYSLGRRKFVGLKRGSPRNGQLNGRKITHTNLIAIPTMESHASRDVSRGGKDQPMKLDLPQHRYCSKLLNEDDDADSKKELSKFSRYDADSNSDSDYSESGEASGEEEKPARSSSLEALVQELEFEISGENTAINKKMQKGRRNNQVNLSLSTSESDQKLSDAEMDTVGDKVNVQYNVKKVEDEMALKKECKVEAQVVQKAKVSVESLHKTATINQSDTKICAVTRRLPLLPNPRGFGSPNGDDFARHSGVYAASSIRPATSTLLRHRAYPPYIPPSINHIADVHHFCASQLPQMPPKPLSPLTFSQEAMTTIVMAPLSPRSAAFVLQNREIIEKRKRSPRHSYSRSPSPRMRVKSPRRASRSPRRYPHSTSPKRLTPTRRPRSPPKPRARSPPERDTRDRLAATSNKRTADAPPPTTDTKPSPPPPPQPPRCEQAEKDAVLVARRRKFEQQSAAHSEGVIRLKPDQRINSEGKLADAETSPLPPPPPPQPQEEQLPVGDDSHDVLETCALDTGIDNLFSDEESEDENEGRFKSASRPRGDEHPLNFSALSKTASVESKPLESVCTRERNNRNRSRRARRDERDRDHGDRSRSTRDSTRKHRSPAPTERKDERRGLRARTREGEEKNAAASSGRPARKVEMLPSKANDRGSKGAAEVDSKPAAVVTTAAAATTIDDAEEKSGRARMRRLAGSRKVAIAVDLREKKELKAKDDVTVIEDDDEHDVVKKTAAGDLRAQLSKKRAERQNQKPAVNAEDVQSRLLHNALGAVFQKAKSSKRAEAEAAPKDKLPIHRRLGLNDDSAVSKKRKSKRTTEQV